jgi:hypothetical protein
MYWWSFPWCNFLHIKKRETQFLFSFQVLAVDPSSPLPLNHTQFTWDPKIDRKSCSGKDFTSKNTHPLVHVQYYCNFNIKLHGTTFWRTAKVYVLFYCELKHYAIFFYKTKNLFLFLLNIKFEVIFLHANSVCLFLLTSQIKDKKNIEGKLCL